MSFETLGLAPELNRALAELGYLPTAGESFESRGWRFEIVDLDGRRIDKMIATRIGVRRAGR